MLTCRRLDIHVGIGTLCRLRLRRMESVLRRRLFLMPAGIKIIDWIIAAVAAPEPGTQNLGVRIMRKRGASPCEPGRGTVPVAGVAAGTEIPQAATQKALA